MKTLIFSLFLNFFAFHSLYAAQMNLSQDQVLKLTEKQSPEVQKLRNIRASQEALYAQASSELNFNLNLALEKKSSKFRSTNGFNITETDADVASVQLSKLFATGTALTLSGSRTSLDLTFSPTSTPPVLETTEDVFSIGLSQNLWNNFFGEASRANLEAAKARLLSSEIQTEIQFEAIVIQNLQLYWKAVTSKKIADETEVSLKRYANLVSQVKRKNSFGTAQPGELSQVQAEFEAQGSALQTARDMARADLENLKTALGLTASDAVTLNPRPNPSSLSDSFAKPSDISNLRRFKILELDKESAVSFSRSQESRAAPQLNAFVQYGTQGLNNDSLGQVTRSEYPETTLGLRYSQSFGNGLNDKLKASAQAEASSAKIDFSLSVQRLNDRAQALYDNLKTATTTYNSLVREREFRLKAANDYTRAFNQGRVDIQNLIQVLNSNSNVEAQLARAQGQYESLLLEWKYFTDSKN